MTAPQNPSCKLSIPWDGVGWPDGLYVDVNDPGPTKTRSWQHFLIQNLSEILPAMVDADSLARRTAA